MRLEEAFGEALKRCRLAKDLSQEDFSDVTGRTYMSVLERGLKSPTLSKMDELAAVLGIHPLTLLLTTYLIHDHEKTVGNLIDVIKKEIRFIK